MRIVRFAIASVAITLAGNAAAAAPPTAMPHSNSQGKPDCDHVCAKPLADFPRVKSWNSLVITLTRTGCFGHCPDYTVEIRGDGTVIFNGRRFVVHTGEYRAKISRAAVRALVDKFRTADYFALADRYVAHATDLPTYTTSIAFDGHQKSVKDYGGQIIGAPFAVNEIENAIDEAANTAQWIKAPDAVP